MKCPVDSAQLVMSDRQGIEIDYCPECRGVWLDRGEIDKIIERSESQMQPTSQPRHEERRPESHDRDHDDNYRQHHDGYNQQHKKKESWFGELFD